ncbi:MULTISPECIES: hypothetical protein [unclassified Burkholderia]|uniref:hypothetical protein n=1 Tax=unclassified Burkholderia TaxID=2613784 RepID=UPI001421274A|nr:MULTISPECIES: hypothetical protein [unclassified Burkholderia]NIE81936.1 hypothetical protein [Burkholderia sp. Tr-860]NIF61764.1 hypothetical protein [Burkholderia sp. Cy-647]NIF94027.1 hypothetical protein [Burkholderia sp. Ax-1720]
MAVFEVAAAASEVAKIVPQTPEVNGWTLVLTSAVVASFVNAGVLVWLKHSDRKREDKANARRRSLAYLDVAYSLEAFAKQADDYCDAIDQALPRYRAHDMKAFDMLGPIHLLFDLPSETVVSELNAEHVDQLREFRERLHQSAAWRAGQGEWANPDDMYEFEMQRAIHFGSEVCRIADAMRGVVGVQPFKVTEQYLAAFDAQFEKLAQQYTKRQGHLELIPELTPRMQSMFPGFPVDESGGL